MLGIQVLEILVLLRKCVIEHYRKKILCGSEKLAEKHFKIPNIH